MNNLYALPNANPRIATGLSSIPRRAGSTSLRGRVAALRVLLAGLALATLANSAVRAETHPPMPPGTYVVGCSTVEQDFSRLRPGETPQQYWEGIPADDGRARYVTDLETSPASMSVSFAVPDDGELFGKYAGKPYTVAFIVCYPAASDSGYEPYTLPNGVIVPRMQRGTQLPKFADTNAVYPLLEFSHGLEGSPLDTDYMQAMRVFASNGYVVAAPFHADARVANLDVDDFKDIVHAIVDFSDYTAMQALRPITLSKMVDALAADPHWSSNIDFNRVAGFGASLGGEALILQAGAKLTVSLGLSSKTVITDPRLTSIATYVPYFGQPLLPAFGRDQSGIDFMNVVPVLGIAGTADTVAPLSSTREGFERMMGTRELISLEDVGHAFDVPSSDDIFTWSLLFLGATTQRDPAMLAQLQRTTSVAGGGDDRIVLANVLPYGPAAGEMDVVEYYNASLDHYFMTADGNEISVLDAGVISGWARTGYVFKAWNMENVRGRPVCRYYGTPGVGPNTHFYSVLANECAILANDPIWTFEGNVMKTEVPANWTCPAADMMVVRMYNNGKGGVANHRYTITPDVINEMVVQGWTVEGPVMCTPP